MAIFSPQLDRRRHLRVRFATSESDAAVVESWVSRDPAQYKESALDYDRALLGF